MSWFKAEYTPLRARNPALCRHCEGQYHAPKQSAFRRNDDIRLNYFRIYSASINPPPPLPELEAV
jgi:hypothetical protein